MELSTERLIKNVNGSTVCGACGEDAEFVQCPARRYLQIRNNNILVYHCGIHTCPVNEKSAKPTEKVKNILRNNSDIKPAQVQSAVVLSALRNNEDWKKVVDEATQVLDKKWISNQKQDIKKRTNPSGENFEALATFKQYCDKEDKLLIYRINDKRCNPDLPSFVFKSSKTQMKIAHNMNRDRDPFMNVEFFFF